MSYPARLLGTLVFATVALVACSSSSSVGASGCYPDGDGINGGSATIELVVNDTGFFAGAADAGMKDILATQNDTQVTFTLRNTGTKPHGFEVACTSVLPAYPDLPAGCSSTACFPDASKVAPIAPGTSQTVRFVTPTPDGLLYPFRSSAPADKDVAALQAGQWSLM